MQEIRTREAQILIVDDQEANVRLLEAILRQAGYSNFLSTTDSRQVRDFYESLHPDLLLLDLMMPNLDGFQVLAQLGALVPDGDYLPILVLTADIASQTKQRALAAGANDFLTKPFDPVEVVLRIQNLLHTHTLHRQLRDQNQILEARVQVRTRELKVAQMEILERLSRAAEFRDDVTGEHTHRVGLWAARIAHFLGMPGAIVALIHEAASLHDVGKIGIPDHILLKPGSLTADEFAIMRTHTTIGADILAGGSSPLIQTAQEIALTHHERWDGTGYPHGLAGAAIPLTGRIVSVVDVYDALTHARPYKLPWPPEEAQAEIRRQAGRQFDPDVVDAFLSLLKEHEAESLALPLALAPELLEGAA
jgi:putative two-component system response regulator